MKVDNFQLIFSSSCNKFKSNCLFTIGSYILLYANELKQEREIFMRSKEGSACLLAYYDVCLFWPAFNSCYRMCCYVLFLDVLQASCDRMGVLYLKWFSYHFINWYSSRFVIIFIINWRLRNEELISARSI